MRKLIFLPAFLIAFYTVNAQTATPQLISSSGDSFNNTSYQLDWSIGELATETYTSSQNILAQGFHQGTYTITSIEENSFIDFFITAYPNPTSNYITLNFKKVQNCDEINFTITDLTGKILQTAEIKSDTEQINFSDYAPGIYLISVIQNNQLIKSFQIVKK